MFAEHLREAMSKFATGICVVTTKNGSAINGFTANSLTSVSLDPPLVLVCIDKKNKSHDMIKASGVFAMNVLAEDQKELSDIFAVPGDKKAELLGKIDTFEAKTGAPVISNCLSYIDCRVKDVFDSGDHSIFIGEVVDTALEKDSSPLLYWSSQYRTF